MLCKVLEQAFFDHQEFICTARFVGSKDGALPVVLKFQIDGWRPGLQKRKRLLQPEFNLWFLSNAVVLLRLMQHKTSLDFVAFCRVHLE